MKVVGLFIHLSLVSLSLISSCITAEENDAANYTGCQLLSLKPETNEENGFLINLYKANVPGMEFWESPNIINRSVSVQLCPTVEIGIQEQLKNISHIVQIHDIQQFIDDQLTENELLGRFDPTTGSEDFALDQYHNLAEIQSFLKVISEEYPEKISVITVGTTLQGNTLQLVKVSDGLSNQTKRIIWIDSGVHAREWVTIASTLYLIKQMVTNNSTLIQNLLKNFDWHFMPVANPDGYKYSWHKDRLWRKNRSVNTPICRGVDLNRNFDIDFKGGGLLTNFVCSQEYKGSSPFSEKETTAIKNYLTLIKDQLTVYISLHSYGQLWLHPYGFSSATPRHFPAMNKVAKLVASAIRNIEGTSYETGTINKQLYHVSGSSVDWAYESLGIKYSYAVELRDKGQYGFLLPRNQIVPTAKELSVALQIIVNNVS